MEYVNIYDYEDPAYPFQVFTGGRGTGKTYGALSQIDSRRLILMRRTADELELLADSKGAETGNPFKELNAANGWDYGLSPINAKVLGIYHRDIIDDKLVPVGAPVGLGVALSTISKVRGMNFSDYTDIVYDEFIPEKHVHKMKGESDALLNAYETINRNREFTGQPPVNLWLLSNSNDIYNPIFIGLGIVQDIERLARQGKEHYYDKERGLAVHLLKSPEEFVSAKNNTAIARLTRGSAFYDMAYGNEFAYNDFTNVIGFRKIAGYIPFLSIDGKCFIYRKKGSKEMYCCYSPTKIKDYKSGNDADKILLQRNYGQYLRQIYINGLMYFESYELKALVLSLIM